MMPPYCYRTVRLTSSSSATLSMFNNSSTREILSILITLRSSYFIKHAEFSRIDNISFLSPQTVSAATACYFETANVGSRCVETKCDQECQWFGSAIEFTGCI
mmetsp:Transcript_6531/g.7489  ORF Transcript_6531/g.7489 Transcript_6531/m.7489 type:complete len:103 (-) Transcript_6531:910-1218(-)